MVEHTSQPDLAAVALGEGAAEPQDATAEELRVWLKRLHGVSGEAFPPLYTQFVNWLADLPQAESGRILTWLERLWKAVREGRIHGTSIEPFVDGILAREMAEAVPLLAEMVGSEHFFMQEDLAESLGEMKQRARRAVPALAAFVRKGGDEEGAWARAKAAAALGNIGDREAVPALLAALADPASCVRQNALGALRTLGAEEATDRILEVLSKDRDPAVRRDAAEVAGGWHAQRVRELVSQLLRGEHRERHREALERVLKELGPG
jgi:hypothetical protein